MSLSDFRVGGEAPPPSRLVEAMPLTFAKGWTVLCFDQSISATGWVYVESGATGVIVRDCGSIMVPPGDFPKGNAGSLLRTDVMATAVDDVLRRCPTPMVLHEVPPVSNAKMSRPEASLMAAVAIRQVARRAGCTIEMVDNRHSKKVLTGNGNADKKQWHAALSAQPWRHAGPPVSNEGQRDALALALTWLAEAEDNW